MTIRKYEDFPLAGYEVPPDYRLLKRTDTPRNLIYLDAPRYEPFVGCTAYMIAWWCPAPKLVRLRVWRSLYEHHQKPIGELPRAFVAALLEQGYDVQLQPVNNAFWRGMAYWALDEGYSLTVGKEHIRFEDQLVREFYDRKRMMTIHGKPQTGDAEFDEIFWQHRKTMSRLADL
ncbi:hypothetical protein ID007_004329 [Salmonella enterica]|nr:hypothetical protein [Salmonella enterica]